VVRKLLDLITRIGRPRVLVVGDLILDRYVWGEADRISPEAPTPVVQLREQDSRAGGAGNVVAMLAGLGARAACCGMIGDDSEGRHLRDLVTRACGGEARFLVDPGRPTSVKTRFGAYVQSARRGMQHILRVDAERTDPLSAAQADELRGMIEELLPGQEAVILSDYNKGLLTSDLTRWLIAQCRQSGVPVLVDPRRGTDWPYRGATLLTPNRYETQLATGITVHDPATMEQAAHRLASDLALDAVFLTLDRDGMYVYEVATGEGTPIRNEPREIADITGAGDAVVAVAGLVLAAGAGFREAAELANIAAGIEIEKIGVAPVGRAEIARRLRERERGCSAKLKDIEELLLLLDEHRQRKETIVFTNGCFDILHIGHIEYLKFARRQGDLLVVGMNSDASVRSLKGPQRPILGEEDRAGMLAGLEDVDYVTIFQETSVEPLVRRVRPDVLVKGEDCRERGVVGREFVESYGGRVVLAPLVEGVSTSDIVARILKRYGDAASRGATPPDPQGRGG